MRNRYFFIIDLICIPIAVVASFVLRLEHIDLFPDYTLAIVTLTASCLVVIPVVFWRTGIYSRYWKYASVEELLLLIGAVTLAVFVSAVITIIVLRLWGDQPLAAMLPRSIPFIFLMLILASVSAARLAPRIFSDSAHGQIIRIGNRDSTGQGERYRQDNLKASLAPARSPVLIMGAGDAGAMILRELQRNPALGFEPVGFLDDDLGKHDVRIHGVPVLGGRSDIPHIVKKYHVRHVIIAMPTAPGKEIRDIVRICEQSGVQTKLIPGIYELIGGKVSVNQLRNVQIEDLLRRDPVQTDVEAVSQLIRGKRVLVTGGGGSIGSELCRQVLQFAPSELVVMGHGENSVFDVHNELARTSPRIYPVIADIRFPDRVHDVLQRHKPNIIFHAAAHKHVPLMEWNPCEAVTNNVIGTRNLLQAAGQSAVECFVMISTDKAVNPSSIMGVSKRVAELLVHQAAHNQSAVETDAPAHALQNQRRYCTVRFGNVLGSRGSVVHTFNRQIAAGGPITITDPEMKRYFMTIPEAVQLVLQASVMGKDGEIFVLDMGEPVKIIDLARDLVELSGLEVGRDIDIVFTGKRPGEKLFEELFLPSEIYQRTQHEKIFIAENASRFAPANLDATLAALEDAARHNDHAAILKLFRCLVPEFSSGS